MVQRLHPKSRKGFNLIEAAIVLGVVGLIIGGIWVAAASVMQKHRAQQTLDGFFFIGEKIKAAYGKEPVTSNCDNTWTNCHASLTTQQIQAMLGTPPAGWHFNADGTLDSPIFRSGFTVEVRDMPDDREVWMYFSTGTATSESDCKVFGVMALKSVSTGIVSWADVANSAWSKYAEGWLSSGAYGWDSDSDSGTGLPDPLLAAQVDGCSEGGIGFNF